MTDAVLPQPAPVVKITAGHLIALFTLLLFALLLLLLLRWSAVLTDSATCERAGGFSSGFSPGFDVARCRGRFFGFAEAGRTSGTFGEAPLYFGP
jgi:hypothetical protein